MKPALYIPPAITVVIFMSNDIKISGQNVSSELRNIISHKLWKTLNDKKVIKGMLKVRGCYFYLQNSRMIYCSWQLMTDILFREIEEWNFEVIYIETCFHFFISDIYIKIK